jgi:glycosyltransferase involved in cell wall biosynthesis
MTKWPKISIVTPAYNCRPYIRRCIESVKAQEYPNFEHIIVDGGSQDETLEVLREYPHLKWVSEKDEGEANALNKGLKMVTGEIVCWLNADDFMSPNAMVPVGREFAAHPEWELVYGKTDMVTPHGAVLWFKQSQPNASMRTLVRWWEHVTMPHQPSMYFRKRLLDRIGPINENLHFSIDLELWLRCARETRFHFIDATLSCATQRPECKSEGTGVDQVKSHWSVVVPFLTHLSFDERVDFWAEYYIGRLTGLKGHSHLEDTRIPDSEEALLGVMRSISHHRKSLGILRYLFPDENATMAVAELLAARGLHFLDGELLTVPDRELTARRAKRARSIVIDGSGFVEQGRAGVSRVWDSILREWSGGSFGRRIVVLDRGGYAPRHPGIDYRLFPRIDMTNLKSDEKLLERICEEEKAELFISTYHTSVTTVPSIMPIYNMTSERQGLDPNQPELMAKHLAIQRASAFWCVSESVRKELLELFPSVKPEQAVVTLCGVDRRVFRAASWDEVVAVCQRYDLDRPYFMLVGGKYGAKNAEMFFEAINKLPTQHGFKVLVTGVHPVSELAEAQTGSQVVYANLTDDELVAAYSGALALVCPSKHEGFGLPLVEAMACGCPVISTPWGGLSEVGGGAAMYATDANSLANIMAELQRPGARQMLVDAGFEHVGKFRWSSMAERVARLCDTVINASQGVKLQRS